MEQIAFPRVNPKLAAAVCGACGSLDYPSSYWSGPFPGLVWAVSRGNFDAALAYSQDIVAGAVPDVGDPHPRRAIVDADDSEVWFLTPGGVTFFFSRDEDGQARIEIVFGRDSLHLAAQILARAYLSDSGCQVRINDAEQTRDIKSALARAMIDQL